MKRFFCVILAAMLLVLLAACSGREVSSTAPTATDVPTSSSRNVRSEPVQVNETHANAEVVDGQSQPAGPTSTATPVNTPPTGDFPLVYFAGALGLILICSAGLLALKKI